MTSEPPTPETTTVYVAKRLIADRGFRPAMVPEAAPLAQACDILLTRTDGLAFEMACLVDRERDPARTFALTREAVVAIGKACSSPERSSRASSGAGGSSPSSS